MIEGFRAAIAERNGQCLTPPKRETWLNAEELREGLWNAMSDCPESTLPGHSFGVMAVACLAFLRENGRLK